MKFKIFIFWATLFLAIFLRLFLLGNVPSGVTNDEASYIYNAYTIWHTGKDITGKFLPLSVNLDNSFSPVPIYIIAPFVGLLGMTATTGRLPFALAGIGVVLLIYFISRKLFKNEYIALSVMFVFAVSPWALQIERTAYDGGLALFFYLLGIYLFIYFEKSKKILFSLIPFLLAFYSYHATKIFFIFLIPILIFYAKNYLFNKKRVLLLFILGVITIILSYVVVSLENRDTRQKVFLWNDTSKAAAQVNWERKVNSAPHLLQTIFSNKPLYFLRVMRENYLQAYSPQFLFLYGETGGLGGIYGIFYRGVMYFIELPLLLLGIFYIANYKEKKLKYFLFSLFLIAPLPTAFTLDQSYVMRSITLLPILAIFTGTGIYIFVKKITLLDKKVIKKIFLLLFGLTYVFFIGEYLYQYYFRYSIYGAENWFKSSKDVSEYVLQNKDKFKKVLIVNPGDLIIQYAFYASMNQSVAQKAYTSHTPKQIGGNVFLIDGCIDTHNKIFDPNIYLNPQTLYIVPDGCFPNSTKPADTITQSGEPLRTIWKIYQRN